MTDNKIKIQIKSVFGKVLFEYEKEGNTVNDTVEEAVKISANLRGADLRGANLRYADLRCANLRCANLRGADNIPLIPFSCPSDGAFIGWKKVKGKLIKLLIPEDAKRQSSTGWKCRCDKAKVLEITDLDGSNPISEITSTQYAECTYKVGEIVYPDSFDDNRWEECSHGIHFFANKQQAIDY